MSNTNTGGPAFPQYAWNEMAEKFTATEGMTLRDYFAAKALQGLLASGPPSHLTDQMLSNEAYRVANAMLKAREE